jgi:F-type H+-transporting ATPase subunit a
LNFCSIIPYSLTTTSHIAVTLGQSIALFLSATVTGLIKHQERLFDMFLPPNIPLFLYPVIIGLEILGYIARAISLGVRLSSNMLAGHVLLKLICMFI